MLKINKKQQNLIAVLLKDGVLSSSEIHQQLLQSGQELSAITVKRLLTQMTDEGLLIKSGGGRSTGYAISAKGRIFANIDAKEYCAVEPDKRYGLKQYNFELLKNIPRDFFTQEENKDLIGATERYRKGIKGLSAEIGKKELERMIIELSWKSSKIEGNTYTLLDTERLILKNQEASGHDRSEARMILNHKEAFEYVRRYSNKYKKLTRRNLEELHEILVKGLSVETGLRKRPVGVIGSIYRPLDNIHQIREAVDDLSEAVDRIKSPYAKALVAILGLSYIQPFEDGNKRTARLLANAILLAYGCSPLSYRSVDENDYREAILVFYELNSAMPFKKIFIDQYLFAVDNYSVK